MSDERLTCESCKFCLLEDYGYSNYTVEGTTVYCLKRAHPDREGFDRFYGKDDRLLFAEVCPSFDTGEPISVDVDREQAPYPADQPWWNFYIADDERRELMAALDAEKSAA